MQIVGEGTVIVDSLPKPAALEGSVEAEVRAAKYTIQVNRYRWNEPREAVFKPDTAIIDIVLSRRSAELQGVYLEMSRPESRPVGDVLFMPPTFTLHSRWNSGERRSMCCVFDACAFPGLFEIDWCDPQLSASLNVCNGFVRGTMLRLASEALAPGFASTMLIESLCTALVIELRRYFDLMDGEETVSANRPLSADQLRRIRESLEEEDDAGSPLTVAELARRQGMSVRHFTRLFRASTGRTVSDFAAQIRIDRARTLLADPRILIKEIAYRCGFQSSSSFSSAFRRATNLTPQQFRSTRLDS
jgi:AraC family transcriptional regulator